MATNKKQKMSTEEVIKLGADTQTIVEIGYCDRKGQSSNRRIEPYEIKDGNALYGYCLQKQSIRRFNMQNITYARNTDNKFTPRWDIKI